MLTITNPGTWNRLELEKCSIILKSDESCRRCWNSLENQWFSPPFIPPRSGATASAPGFTDVVVLIYKMGSLLLFSLSRSTASVTLVSLPLFNSWWVRSLPTSISPSLKLRVYVFSLGFRPSNYSPRIVGQRPEGPAP